MNGFLKRHKDKIVGILNGFDRVLFRGTIRWLASLSGMGKYMGYTGILLKDFKEYALSATQRVRQATEALAASAGRPLLYIQDPNLRKEDLAREVAERDGIREGLICVLSVQEPAYTYTVAPNRSIKQLELRLRRPPCLHYYHYGIHPELGFFHVRVQSWLPFTLHVCINGREWLARQMDRAGLRYVRDHNCFLDIEDLGKAQELFDEQLRTNWKDLLDRLIPQVHPAHAEIFAAQPLEYYWSASQTEWASDVMFRSPQDLAELYPRLIHQGMVCLSSRDVLRFLGRKVPAQGGVNGHFQGQVKTDLKNRPEGVRLKHYVNENSIKMYDKSGSVLRVETTVNNPRDMVIFGAKQSDPEGPKRWSPMKKGVSDLHRRAQVSQAANERYLEAMACVPSGCSVGQLAEPLCRPVRWNKGRFRALNPLSSSDAALLEAVSSGEFCLLGFRNADLRAALCGSEDHCTPQELRRRSGLVTRKLRLLRAHKLIRKVPHTHRYRLTTKGQGAIATLLLVRKAHPDKLDLAA